MIEEAIILVGGLGTRLGSIVKDIPKPLANVGGKPFLWHLVNKLLKEDIKRIIFSAGYKSELIGGFVREFFHDKNIDVVVEEEPLGTGGAIKFAMPFVLGDCFFLLNGDSFFDISLSMFETDSFSIGDFDISIALCEMENPERFGIVEIDRHFSVLRFREKNSRRGKSYINAGVYILKKSALEGYLKDFRDKFSFEKDVLERLDLCTVGIPYRGNFIDIGLPEDYVRASTIGL
ncbi:MAG: D-glycero-D-manno-heptose 1-phosphate guanosyltransferase [Candidatus Dadabacteria bacterium]